MYIIYSITNSITLIIYGINTVSYSNSHTIYDKNHAFNDITLVKLPRRAI